jgi:AraC family transcriptional regulator
LIACIIGGAAEFQEREIDGVWVPRHVQRGDIFITGSETPYELRRRSSSGAELDVIHIHLTLDQCRAVFETVYRDKATAVEVIEFFGRDETLAHLIFACAKMLSTRTTCSSQSVAAIARLLAIDIAEKYTNLTSPKLD